MATWRARHSTGGSHIPYDNVLLMTMIFFIVLAAFYYFFMVWGFGLTGWGERII